MINDRFSPGTKYLPRWKISDDYHQIDRDHQARRILDDTASVIESQYSGLGNLL